MFIHICYICIYLYIYMSIYICLFIYIGFKPLCVVYGIHEGGHGGVMYCVIVVQ